MNCIAKLIKKGYFLPYLSACLGTKEHERANPTKKAEPILPIIFELTQVRSSMDGSTQFL